MGQFARENESSSTAGSSLFLICFNNQANHSLLYVSSNEFQVETLSFLSMSAHKTLKLAATSHHGWRRVQLRRHGPVSILASRLFHELQYSTFCFFDDVQVKLEIFRCKACFVKNPSIPTHASRVSFYGPTLQRFYTSRGEYMYVDVESMIKL